MSPDKRVTEFLASIEFRASRALRLREHCASFLVVGVMKTVGLSSGGEGDALLWPDH